MWASYVTQPADTDKIDDDENWNLLAKASPERLSGVPRVTHQNVSSTTRAEMQQGLPEQAYVNKPFRLPVSPNHGPQEPKHYRSLVYSAQPQEVLWHVPCLAIEPNCAECVGIGTIWLNSKARDMSQGWGTFDLKKSSHNNSVINLSPGKSSGDAGSPARHIQGADTACLRPFTRGHTVDRKQDEAEAESRYSHIRWQRLYQYHLVIPFDGQCWVGTAGPVTGYHV